MTSNEELNSLVKRLFKILDTVEVSDSGRKFRPTYITSCRILHTEELHVLLSRMKEIVGE